MKIIFAGTPDAAVPTLKALLSQGMNVVAVLTRPDSPQGRKKVLTPSPVAVVARDASIPVIYANRIDEEKQSLIDSYAPDLGVVVAYGALLPQHTLDAPKHGWINLHFSSLPAWRGAAPVQWQVLSGATKAGSSVFSLVKELDAGDIFDVCEYAINPDETSGELLQRLSELGADQVLSVVESIESGTATSQAQKGDISYARKLESADGHLALSSARHAYNQFRGVTPEPGAFVLFNNERLKILEARLAEAVQLPSGVIRSIDKNLYLGCSEGALELRTIQPFGKQPMSAMDWFRGLRQEEVIVS